MDEDRDGSIYVGTNREDITSIKLHGSMITHYLCYDERVLLIFNVQINLETGHEPIVRLALRE